MDRIAIVGPGAIGSLFGALLARDGQGVFLLDHRERRAASRETTGIRVCDGDAEWHVAVASSTHAADFGIADVVFVCTKAHQTATAIPSIKPLIGPDTILVSLQNGIGNVEQLSVVAPQHCICGTTAMGAILHKGGMLRWTGHGPTQLAAFRNTPDADATTISTLLTEAGCESQVLPDADSMLWGKLIINAAINPITAIYRISNGELLEDGETRDLAFAAAREAKAVADALGIALPYDDVIAAITRVCVNTAANRSSMLQDVEHGRHTEIDAITGAIISKAHPLNIPVPQNEALLERVNRIANRCLQG